MGAAKESGEKAEHGGSHQSGEGTHRGGSGVVDAAESLNTECKSQRKGNNTGCDAAKNVAFDVVRLYKFHISYSICIINKNQSLELEIAKIQK